MSVAEEAVYWGDFPFNFKFILIYTNLKFICIVIYVFIIYIRYSIKITALTESQLVWLWGRYLPL